MRKSLILLFGFIFVALFVSACDVVPSGVVAIDGVTTAVPDSTPQESPTEVFVPTATPTETKVEKTPLPTITPNETLTAEPTPTITETPTVTPTFTPEPTVEKVHTAYYEYFESLVVFARANGCPDAYFEVMDVVGMDLDEYTYLPAEVSKVSGRVQTVIGETYFCNTVEEEDHQYHLAFYDRDLCWPSRLDYKDITIVGDFVVEGIYSKYPEGLAGNTFVSEDERRTLMAYTACSYQRPSDSMPFSFYYGVFVDYESICRAIPYPSIVFPVNAEVHGTVGTYVNYSMSPNIYTFCSLGLGD